MSAQCEVTGKRAAAAPLSFFERYLTIWVFVGLTSANGSTDGQRLALFDASAQGLGHADQSKQRIRNQKSCGRPGEIGRKHC